MLQRCDGVVKGKNVATNSALGRPVGIEFAVVEESNGGPVWGSRGGHGLSLRQIFVSNGNVPWYVARAVGSVEGEDSE